MKKVKKAKETNIFERSNQKWIESMYATDKETLYELENQRLFIGIILLS